jgi:hypothetical protein
MTPEIGALGSWGAALLEPYSDKAESDGVMRFDTAELTDLMKALWHADWQVVGGSNKLPPLAMTDAKKHGIRMYTA